MKNHKRNRGLNFPLLITIVFGVISASGWIYFKGNDWSELCLNLFAGFLSSAITIAVIENVLKKEKERNEIPIRMALYRDVQMFMCKLVDFWEQVYVQSTHEREYIHVYQFFAVEHFAQICDGLNLKCKPNVESYESWFEYMAAFHKEMVEQGEKILYTYTAVLDPMLVLSLKYLMNESNMLGWFKYAVRMHNDDILKNIPRPPILSYHRIIPNNQDYEMLIQLFTWCDDQLSYLHRKLKSDDVKSRMLYIVTMEIFGELCEDEPTSYLSEEDRKEYIKLFEDWENNN